MPSRCLQRSRRCPSASDPRRCHRARRTVSADPLRLIAVGKTRKSESIVVPSCRGSLPSAPILHVLKGPSRTKQSHSPLTVLNHESASDRRHDFRFRARAEEAGGGIWQRLCKAKTPAGGGLGRGTAGPNLVRVDAHARSAARSAPAAVGGFGQGYQRRAFLAEPGNPLDNRRARLVEQAKSSWGRSDCQRPT